ncbi:MAG: exo-alpha-sialidase [Flammeovirgaceae bacterium]|nr:exo-alpha-sialidase [Flammeovirgaceae bacterium]
MKRFFLLILVIPSVGYSQFLTKELINYREGIYPPLEPSIIINKKNPDNIVAAVVLDRTFHTFDKGKTWEEVIVESPYGVYGDPALISDAKGNFYFFHLADPSGEGRKGEDWLDRMVVHKSGDGGKTWDEGRSIGYNPPKDQDKEWPAVHFKKSYVYLTWTQFDKYGSTDSTCQSNIMFSISKNGGKKWSKSKVISHIPGDCIDSDNTTEGAVPAVYLDGKIFVAWSNDEKIYFDRSFDDGEIWLQNDIVAAEQPGGWDMDIPGISRCNGMPVTMIDNSPGKFQGTVYIAWADQRNGANNTDIWLTRSKNGGDNWDTPYRVNKDESDKHQFLPWMAIDQSTGYVYLVYYDRRAYDDLQTDVYLAYSTDGGGSFSEIKISETPFIPTNSKFFGDYTNISAQNGTIAVIWTRMDEGKTSVWTSIIDHAQLEGK